MTATLTALLILIAGFRPLGWPVDEPLVVDGFRPPTEAYAAGHRGIDLRADSGDPVRAMATGQISFVGRVAGKPVLVVALPGPGERRVTYEPVLATVAVGDRVAEGAVIGTVAVSGGHCGGDVGCLHVGLRTSVGYLDPLTLVKRRPAVLKPSRR